MQRMLDPASARPNVEFGSAKKRLTSGSSRNHAIQLEAVAFID